MIIYNYWQIYRSHPTFTVLFNPLEFSGCCAVRRYGVGKGVIVLAVPECRPFARIVGQAGRRRSGKYNGQYAVDKLRGGIQRAGLGNISLAGNYPSVIGIRHQVFIYAIRIGRKNGLLSILKPYNSICGVGFKLNGICGFLVKLYGIFAVYTVLFDADDYRVGILYVHVAVSLSVIGNGAGGILWRGGNKHGFNSCTDIRAIIIHAVLERGVEIRLIAVSGQRKRGKAGLAVYVYGIGLFANGAACGRGNNHLNGVLTGLEAVDPRAVA